MRRSARKKQLERAAAELAWGKSMDQVAGALQIPREKLQEWMGDEEFRSIWSRRFSEYVRYLQGPSVALLERQLGCTDEKIRAAAAASLIKMGEQLTEEADTGLKVHFAMPMPGEPEAADGAVAQNG